MPTMALKVVHGPDLAKMNAAVPYHVHTPMCKTSSRNNDSRAFFKVGEEEPLGPYAKSISESVCLAPNHDSPIGG